MTIYAESGDLSAAVFEGPTCNSVDRSDDRNSLPELSLGDVIMIHENGTYSIPMPYNFNRITPPMSIDLDDKTEAKLKQTQVALRRRTRAGCLSIMKDNSHSRGLVSR